MSHTTGQIFPFNADMLTFSQRDIFTYNSFAATKTVCFEGYVSWPKLLLCLLIKCEILKIELSKA